jgi:hypothetical protein
MKTRIILFPLAIFTIFFSVALANTGVFLGSGSRLNDFGGRGVRWAAP